MPPKWHAQTLPQTQSGCLTAMLSPIVERGYDSPLPNNKEEILYKSQHMLDHLCRILAVWLACSQAFGICNVWIGKQENGWMGLGPCRGAVLLFLKRWLPRRQALPSFLVFLGCQKKYKNHCFITTLSYIYCVCVCAFVRVPVRALPHRTYS